MKYALTLKGSARKQFDQLPAAMKERIATHLDALRSDPRPAGAEALTGEFRGLFRLRVGGYRVMFALDDASRRIIVTRVAPRGRVYR